MHKREGGTPAGPPGFYFISTGSREVVADAEQLFQCAVRNTSQGFGSCRRRRAKSFEPRWCNSQTTISREAR